VGRGGTINRKKESTGVPRRVLSSLAKRRLAWKHAKKQKRRLFGVYSRGRETERRKREK
jgi:hypothetical protein